MKTRSTILLLSLVTASLVACNGESEGPSSTTQGQQSSAGSGEKAGEGESATPKAPVSGCPDDSAVGEGDPCSKEGLECPTKPSTYTYCACSANGTFDCTGHDVAPICENGAPVVTACPDDRLVLTGEACAQGVVCAGMPDATTTRAGVCKDGVFALKGVCGS